MSAKGGRGHKSAQDKVLAMREEGKSETEIRERLRGDGYKTGRISQLLTATRPAAAAPVRRLRRKTAPAEVSPQTPPAKKRRGLPADPVRSPWRRAAAVDRHALAIEGDAAEVEEELSAHALSIRPWLREYDVDGDGRCFFRAVAWQLPDGEDRHRQLRQDVVLEVQNKLHLYQAFFLDGQAEQWLAGMATRQWADDAAVQACCNLLQKPVVIHRKGVDQAPTIKVPHIFQPHIPFRPLQAGAPAPPQRLLARRPPSSPAAQQGKREMWETRQLLATAGKLVAL